MARPAREGTCGIELHGGLWCFLMALWTEWIVVMIQRSRRPQGSIPWFRRSSLRTSASQMAARVRPGKLHAIGLRVVAWSLLHDALLDWRWSM